MIRARVMLWCALACHGIRAGAQDTAFVVPGSHLDLGFTAPISEVYRQRIAIVDRAIDIAQHDPAFVWFEEGGWAVEAWLDHNRDQPQRIAALRALVTQGRFGVGATELSPHAAAFPEVLSQLTMHLDRIEHELGRRPTVAVINDVPAIPEAVIDALAAHGVRYLLMGTNRQFSAPLPAAIADRPFYWRTARGAKMLVLIQPDVYMAGLTHWLLPPECARAWAGDRLPASMSDADILRAGVGTQFRTHPAVGHLMLVQQAMDNGDPECAAHLPAAAAMWNRMSPRQQLVIATPDAYFARVARLPSAMVPTRTGEWGGDWDLLRMSEPVWSWRLRQAMASLNNSSPRQQRMAAVMATDHNVGLGPRWMDGVSATSARQHVREVSQLYQQVVRSSGGDAALTSLPAPMQLPAASTLADAWRRITGAGSGVARVRAGASFLDPLVPPDAPVSNIVPTVRGDSVRLVIRTTIDRVMLEQQLGPRYQAVIEVRIGAPLRSIRLTPADQPDTPWVMGAPPRHVLSPAGARVDGPGWSFVASGPLLMGWAVVPDPRDPGVSWLQALAVVNAVEGQVADGQTLRLPFDVAYPGEPSRPVFDLVLHRIIGGKPAR